MMKFGMLREKKESITDLKNNKMKDIWIGADFHLGHKNIVLGETEWKNTLNECRKFQTLKEHDDTIIDTINKYVKKNDILYIVGDFSLGGRENVKKYRQRLNCLIIHVCLGNHDVHLAKNCVFADGTKAFDLFTSVKDRIYKKIYGVHFDIGHWAKRAWQNGANGSINLHGDAHGNLTQYEKLLQIADDPYLYKTGDLYKQMDVGIDVAYNMFGEYRPFHISEILKIMEKRINLNVDHH